MSKFIVTKNCVVTLPSGKMKLVRGSEVPDDLPPGRFASLERAGWIAPEEAWVPDPEPGPEPGPSGDPDQPPESPSDWLDTPLADLGLDDRIQGALVAVNLMTVRSLLEFGRENDGDLTAIKGVGETTAAEIKSAIDQLKPN